MSDMNLSKPFGFCVGPLFHGLCNNTFLTWYPSIPYVQQRTRVNWSLLTWSKVVAWDSNPVPLRIPIPFIREIPGMQATNPAEKWRFCRDRAVSADFSVLTSRITGWYGSFH